MPTALEAHATEYPSILNGGAYQRLPPTKLGIIAFSGLRPVRRAPFLNTGGETTTSYNFVVFSGRGLSKLGTRVVSHLQVCCQTHNRDAAGLCTRTHRFVRLAPGSFFHGYGEYSVFSWASGKGYV